MFRQVIFYTKRNIRFVLGRLTIYHMEYRYFKNIQSVIVRTARMAFSAYAIGFERAPISSGLWSRESVAKQVLSEDAT